MNGKMCAVIWNFIHSIADVIEEKILLQNDEKKYFLGINFIVLIGIFLFTFFFPVEFTGNSLIVIFFYTISFIGGDYCYAKSIVHVPIGLANLISSGSLFLILICDMILGYITPRPIFFVLFFVFFCSVTIFSNETNKMKKEIQNKKVDLTYVFLLITSTIFYSAEPYFIKLANSLGANEWAINLFSSFFAVVWWGTLFFNRRSKIRKSENKKFSISILLVGFLYTITSILYMAAYASESPIIVSLILQLQVFLVVLISVFQKTDKMNWKKIVSLFFSVVALILMTLMS